MQDPIVLDAMTIEARARALRAAYARDMVRGLIARLRGLRAADAAHA